MVGKHVGTGEKNTAGARRVFELVSSINVNECTRRPVTLVGVELATIWKLKNCRVIVIFIPGRVRMPEEVST